MPLSILSDQQVCALLESLTLNEAEIFIKALKDALHEYSTGTQSIEAGLIHQPDRTVVHSNLTDTTTMFMPALSPAGHAVKVLTAPSPSSSTTTDTAKASATPTGSLTLYSTDGAPIGFLHAKNLTAFRTALASCCLLTKRATVKTLTVFGVGLQAYWHIRLALMLRGSTVKTVNIINRRFSEQTKHIMKKFYAVPVEIKRREGWESAQFEILTPGYGEFERLQKEYLRDADVIYCCTPSTTPLFDASILTNHEGRRKGRLIVAIGSYKENMHELPGGLLEQAVKHHEPGRGHFHKHATEGGVIIVDTLDGAMKEAGEIISAGLKPTQLVELGELVMIKKLKAAEREEGDSVYSQTSRGSTDASSELDRLDLSPGASAMSSVFGSSDTASKRSGSRSPSRSNSGFFSLGKKRTSSQGSVDRVKENKEDHLSRWLTTGNVIYKSVGLGLMDLTVGMEVIKIARKKGIGNHIEDFS